MSLSLFPLFANLDMFNHCLLFLLLCWLFWPWTPHWLSQWPSPSLKHELPELFHTIHTHVPPHTRRLPFLPNSSLWWQRFTPIALMLLCVCGLECWLLKQPKGGRVVFPHVLLSLNSVYMVGSHSCSAVFLWWCLLVMYYFIQLKRKQVSAQNWTRWSLIEKPLICVLKTLEY